MSELKNAATETVDEHGAQDLSQDRGLLAVILAFLVGLVVMLIVGWVIFPELLYSEKEQPVQFNHELHMYEVYNGCESCHYFREDGTFSGVPTLNECIDCHEYPIGNTEAELNFVDNYVAQGKEVPWLIYSRQPDCVFFSHAAHVVKAEMACKTCHGPIETSTSLKPYEENRLTGYSRDIWGKELTGISFFKDHVWQSMKMDDCARCHKEQMGSQGECFQCHK